MNKILATLLADAALCIVSCFCAPIITPPHAEPATVSSVKEAANKWSSSLADVEDVMMDPTAKMSWQKQEGDITYLTDKFLLPEDPDDPFFERPTTDSAQRSKRAAIKNRHRLWANGVVPYVISDAYTASQRGIIIKAMDHWENHTCIRFVPRTTQRDYVTFFPGKGCYSYIGRIGGNQGISVGRWCLAVYIVLHEIGHAIGYFHEQSRPDRDEHVKIIKENIGDNRELQFEKLTEDKVDSYGVGYDYNSIMHYDETAFSRNGNQTIVALDPDIPIGMAQVLSALDIEQTKRLYNCPATPPPRSTIAPNDSDNAGGLNFPSQLPYPECGGFFTNLSGTIESPGFPQYTHNVDCGWFFKMPLTAFHIVFVFEPFNVEQSPNCESDYIQLYESLNTSGYNGGKKCGNNYSFFPMVTWTSYAYLHFHTNGSNSPNLRGFKLKYSAVDVNECYPGLNQCSHGCNNFEGGFECSCPDGFFMSSDGENCFDVNECGLDKGGCDHKCVNKAGTYRCACDEGYTLARDNRTCLENETADPCAEADCQHQCQVVNSTAQCLCLSGYQLATNQRSCIDINECLSNNGNCQQQCLNTDGSYICACSSGYDLQSNGRSCMPTDPCAMNNGSCQHICAASNGSHECSCRSGYDLDDDGVSCNDINECAINGGKGDCGHTCTNTLGSRVCSCPNGYQLLSDQVSCEASPTIGSPTTMTESSTTTTDSSETKIPLTQSLIATQSRVPKPEVTEPVLLSYAVLVHNPSRTGF